MKKILLICSFIFAFSLIVVPVFSQENAGTDDFAGISAYSTGDQGFSVSIGGILPLFYIAPVADAGSSSFIPMQTLKPGVSGNIEWGAFVTDNLMLGMELSGMFAGSTLRTLTMVPVTFKTTYYFIAYPFEFPVFINAGFSFNTLGDYFTITPVIKPGFGAYWNINGEWALGLNCAYWFVPEIYFGEMSSQTRLANLMQISLSAVYHF